MGCRPIGDFAKVAFSDDSPKESINTPLRLGTQDREETGPIYLCDSSDDVSSFLAKASGPSLASSSRLFLGAPPSVLSSPRVPPSPVVLHPRPESPLAGILYDLMTQLEDFELNANLKVPVIDRYGGKTRTARAHLDLGDKGMISVLDVEFRPYLGPMPAPHPVAKVGSNIPIVGIFALMRIFEVKMDPATRKLEGHVKVLIWAPLEDELHKYLEGTKIPESVLTGPGYNLYDSVPRYSWQAVEVVEKLITEKKEGVLRELSRKTGLNRIEPIFKDGELWVTGNFSNRGISMAGARLHFFPLPKGQKHRFLVKGNLLKPVVKVWGLQEFQVGNVRFINDDPTAGPVEIQVQVDPDHPGQSLFTMPHYQSNRIRIENIPDEGTDQTARLSLQEGIEIKGLRFQMTPTGPKVGIDQLITKQIGFNGLGVHLQTTPGDRTVFEDVKFSIIAGKPYFSSKVRGRGSGQVAYFREQEELGYLNFQTLEGEGMIMVYPDRGRKNVVEIVGNVSAKMPELGLIVKSEKMKGYVRTVIQDATVAGRGRLRVWPGQSEIAIEALDRSKRISIHGLRGQVIIHQEPSRMEEWPELRKNLGALAEKVVTNFFIDLKEIRFDVTKMNLRSIIQAKSKTPALEIEEADLGPIDVVSSDEKGKGAFGTLFVRLPNGTIRPIVIGQTEEDRKKGGYNAKMKNARIRIGRLLDLTAEEGDRKVKIVELSISGVESQPTFSKRLQRVCGIDRQHIHAALGLFAFDPESREIEIRQPDPHFHIFIRKELEKGCLMIGELD